MKRSTFFNGILIGLMFSNILYFTTFKQPVTATTITKKPALKISNKPSVIHVVSNNYPKTISSRGETHFKQIGLLFNENKQLTLPLFGKPTYKGSNNWNYYTYVNTYNQILLPLEIDNRDCMSDIGCKELFDDDVVFINSYGQNFTVKIYNIGLTIHDSPI